METHAQYSHANPLPVCGVIFGPMTPPAEPPPVGVGRVVKHFTGESNNYPKTRAPVPNRSGMTAEAVRARYVACLSTTRWVSAAEIAIKLDLHATSVVKAMKGRTMASLVTAKRDGYRLIWKLKK